MGSDYVIVGAGPTGCALGSYLARAGAAVTLVEQSPVLEGVVGESMLPWCRQVFEELGFDERGFLVKRGAVFCRDARAQRFDFSEAESDRFPAAQQVQREIFDQRWRDVARAHGCTIRFTTARRFDPARCVLETEDGDLAASRVIDAGGRGMWMSRQLGLRRGDVHLRNAGIGTRMEGVRSISPDEEGDITICATPHGWIWIIPFGGGIASVGTVQTRESPLTGSPEERLAAAIALSPAATARLKDARRILPLRGVQDFTATSTRLHGDGFALCGDAAMFVDPIFSSGVLLGLHGARELAAALCGGDLDVWETRYKAAASVFRAMVDAWYAGDFLTVALSPATMQKRYHRRGIVSLLAGDVYDPKRSAGREMAATVGELAARLRTLPSTVDA